VPGTAIGVDPGAKVCAIRLITDEVTEERYDHVVLAAGSVTRGFDIPGVPAEAHGMKTLAEAVALRDHVIAQLDLAAATCDPEERDARLRFVVVGGGYAGTETAAYLQRLTASAARGYPGLSPEMIRWHLVDLSPRLMPELGDHLGRKAQQLLCVFKRDNALCEPGPDATAPNQFDCRPGCGNAVRLGSHARELLDEARRINQLAAHSPQPLGRRLRATSERHRADADTHHATAQPAEDLS
jgi:glycine/D-amino acid oxidase-like deaminating enzyme